MSAEVVAILQGLWGRGPPVAKMGLRKQMPVGQALAVGTSKEGSQVRELSLLSWEKGCVWKAAQPALEQQEKDDCSVGAGAAAFLGLLRERK